MFSLLCFPGALKSLRMTCSLSIFVSVIRKEEKFQVSEDNMGLSETLYYTYFQVNCVLYNKCYFLLTVYTLRVCSICYTLHKFLCFFYFTDTT